MSLLRDALKKAELAQEQARQQTGAPDRTLEPAPAFELLVVEAQPLVEEAADPAIASPDTEQPQSDPSEGLPRGKTQASPAVLWEPNPRRPFHVAVAALAVMGLGVGGYFWIQLRAPSAPFHAAPSRAPSHAHADPAKPAAAGPSIATVEEALASLPKPAPVTGRASEANASAKEEPPALIPERKVRVAPLPAKEVAFATRIPAAANAAPQETDTAAHHFSLGNRHARDGRWREAQQAFARAVAGDPGNPDFAFNLAVSLDWLGQAREARERYRQALSLRQSHPAQFPVEAARERMLFLAR